MPVIVTFQQFKIYRQLLCAVSTRQYGTIKEKGEVFSSNLDDFVKTLGILPKKIVFTKQIHGNTVIEVHNDKKQIIGEADGLVTNKKGIVIGIATADCLPIVFFDPKKEIVGVAHAGYKGLLAGILDNILKEFVKNDSISQDILVGIGPSIQRCCYTVEKARIEMFKKQFPKMQKFFYEAQELFHLDLSAVTKFILLENGILEENIEDLGICTSDMNDMFFSFRKDSPETFGEFATIIGLL